MNITKRIKNTGQNGGKPMLDLNVEAAWAQGFTGKNVTTAIMDDDMEESFIILIFALLISMRELCEEKWFQ
ncbi:hypothetical protein Anas_05326 [Armadillidium nasatum]|uniref:Uncharacterized protein n=1 Tax=Armadillidium nasatum TaxID=96803 RepID=A0A5N5SX34_9CRUS|nr:hypothetical protein Anas_05326 [Armadillidium nasatum]